MKKFLTIILVIFISSTFIYSQGEAGAIWLMIKPGGRYTGMGQAGGAVSDDAYATYYNPSGLRFQSGREFTLQHTKWLPSLADDIYYDFLGYKQYFEDYGTIGGHVTRMNLGTQIQTDEQGTMLGEFTSYMMAVTGSYGTRLSKNTAFGLNIKLIQQHLSEGGAGAEQGSGNAVNFAFGVGYMKKEFLTDNLSLGISIQNIGNKIAFIDVAQADPMPTNLKLGFNYEIESEYNSVKFIYDMNKLLVSRYPARDLDGDGKVGFYNEDGDYIGPEGGYNKDGKYEAPHTDPWYKAIFTSWVDDWLLYKNPDLDGNNQVGGYDENGNPAEDGKYNKDGDKEVKSGSISNELEKLTHNFGIEYWYAGQFAIRTGFLYDKSGDLTIDGKWPMPTFGAGLKYAGMRFDFGYTFGDSGHPRANTKHFSMNIEF